MDRNLKIGIVSSIIASCLFLILLEPILRGISGILFGWGSGLFRGYIDRLFTQAALLAPPDSSFELLVIVLTFPAGLLTGYLITRTALFKKAKSERSPEEAQVDKLRPFPWLLLVINVLILFIALWLLYSHMFQLRVISSFKQHMTAIGPHITDAQTKQFYSQWTQMRSEADYKRIYADLTLVAEQNNIRLPENFVFSLRQL